MIFPQEKSYVNCFSRANALWQKEVNVNYKHNGDRATKGAVVLNATHGPESLSPILKDFDQAKYEEETANQKQQLESTWRTKKKSRMPRNLTSMCRTKVRINSFTGLTTNTGFFGTAATAALDKETSPLQVWTMFP